MKLRILSNMRKRVQKVCNKKPIGSFFTAVTLSTLTLTFIGCRTTGQSEFLAIREDDFAKCLALATNALSKEHSVFRLDIRNPVLFEINDWQRPIVTVWLPCRLDFIPLDESPRDRDYLYFKYRGNGEGRKGSTLASVSSQSPHTFELIENGGKFSAVECPTRTH